MKVAIIRQRYLSHGGAETIISRFVDDLARRGHRIHIFASRWKGEGGRPSHIVFHRVPILRSGSFLKLISFAFFCYLKIKREPFDLIHSFEKTIYQDLYRAGDGCHREWLDQRRKHLSSLGKVLLGLNPFHWATLFIEKRIFSGGKTRKIIANSNRGKEEIMRHYGTSPAKIEVIYNGVDLVRFHPANKERYRNNIRSHFGIDEKEFVILFVGSGFERKGLKFLIEAAGLLRMRYFLPPFRILVVGKGKIKGYLRMARKVEVGEYFIFAGTFEKIDQIYAAGDLLALPTLYDPFANVCLEAMASGIPVITTRMNGASELMTGPLASLILEDAIDVEGLAEIIFKLTDSNRRAELGHLSRKAAEGFPDVRLFDKIVSIYEELAGKVDNVCAQKQRY